MAQDNNNLGHGEALRIEVPGGRFHMPSRENERRAIFQDDRARAHLLEFLEELPQRFGTRMHSCEFMPNHYHLLIETPEVNLSWVGQWLNVSYSTWFNCRHELSAPAPCRGTSARRFGQQTPVM